MASQRFVSQSLLVVLLAVLLNIAVSVFSPQLSAKFLSREPKVTTVKLYGSPKSTCTRRVATILKEKDIPYELVVVDLGKGEHKSAEYLSTKQPFGQVPVLQDGDFILYESRAISRYLVTKYASRGNSLIPSKSDLLALAKFEEAASVEQNNFDPFASGIASELVFKINRDGKTDKKRLEEYKSTLKQKLQGYERILGKQLYLAGNETTLADLFHLPYGTMITDLGFDFLTSSDNPNVARWWKDISSRPSWQAVKDGA